MKIGFKLGAVYLSGLAIASSSLSHAAGLEDWIRREKDVATERLLKNVSPPGTARGAIIASPAREYYFHWVRDAALAMSSIDRVSPATAERYLGDFARFSRANQMTPNWSGARGIGEPKFHVDGSAFQEGWGRPQDDGPALRASVLIRWAERLLDSGRIEEAKKLYDSKSPTDSVIKADLEYVSHHWEMSSYDLWEEVRGHHFYTRMVQRRALLDGARLADRMGDGFAASWYRSRAALIERAIQDHWDASRGYFVATLGRDGGLGDKHTGIDSAVILAVLHSAGEDGFISVKDPRALATIQAQMDKFAEIYGINRARPDLAPAIGRYPEDAYYGGNPWFLLTAAFAEYHFKLARALESTDSLEVTAENRRYLSQRLGRDAGAPGTSLKRGGSELTAVIASARKLGDSFLERVRYHTPEDGSLPEQLDRENGFARSMPDLTWSYAAILTAFKSRETPSR